MFSCSGIIESRRIFRKLKAYIVYRFAATIQIVIVLTLLIYISNCPIDSLYIVLLALLNDLTLLPIAYDRQNPSAKPEFPDIYPILVTSVSLGLFQTGLSMLWAYGSYQTGFFKSNFDIFECGTEAQAGVWVQMFISTEILVFAARVPSFFWCSLAPSPALMISIFLGCLIVSIIACSAEYFGSLYVQDVAIIWLYDIICLLAVDFVKVLILNFLGENFEVLDIKEPEGVPLEKAAGSEKLSSTKSAGGKDLEMGDIYQGGKVIEVMEEEGEVNRVSSTVKQLEKWRQLSSTNVLSGSNPSDPSRLDASRSVSNTNISLPRQASNIAVIAAKRSRSTANEVHAQREVSNTRILVPPRDASLGSSIDLRRGKLSSSNNLRPYTPVNMAARK
jgi:hypothetical protein